jgi:hypothetical protein
MDPPADPASGAAGQTGDLRRAAHVVADLAAGLDLKDAEQELTVLRVLTPHDPDLVTLARELADRRARLAARSVGP